MQKLNKFPLEVWIQRAQKIGDESSKEAAGTDSTDKFPVETLLKIIENQLLTVSFPISGYGAGLGLEAGTNYALLCILKHLGRGNLVIGRIYEGHINASLLMALFGSDEQIHSLALKVKNGGLLGAWNTQADAGLKLTFCY
jgi:alkylation response protein AidB-like acyl-CoA dehydrogenase